MIIIRSTNSDNKLCGFMKMLFVEMGFDVKDVCREIGYDNFLIKDIKQNNKLPFIRDKKVFMQDGFVVIFLEREVRRELEFMYYLEVLKEAYHEIGIRIILAYMEEEFQLDCRLGWLKDAYRGIIRTRMDAVVFCDLVLEKRLRLSMKKKEEDVLLDIEMENDVILKEFYKRYRIVNSRKYIMKMERLKELYLYVMIKNELEVDNSFLTKVIDFYLEHSEMKEYFKDEGFCNVEKCFLLAFQGCNLYN